MTKYGRNDPCPCGSGKKFKKCCSSKMLGQKFMVSKIETGLSSKKGESSLSSIFKSHVETPIQKENVENEKHEESNALTEKQVDEKIIQDSNTDEKSIHLESNVDTKEGEE